MGQQYNNAVTFSFRYRRSREECTFFLVGEEVELEGIEYLNLFCFVCVKANGRILALPDTVLSKA